MNMDTLVGRRRQTLQYNGLKIRVLRSLARSGLWTRPTTLWVGTRTGPIDNVWSYLARLWRWGLLERRRGATGLLEYRITDRGRERLEWLESTAAAEQRRGE